MGFAGAVNEHFAHCIGAAAASRVGARWLQGDGPTSLELILDAGHKFVYRLVDLSITVPLQSMEFDLTTKATSVLGMSGLLWWLHPNGKTQVTLSSAMLARLECLNMHWRHLWHV